MKQSDERHGDNEYSGLGKDLCRACNQPTMDHPLATPCRDRAVDPENWRWYNPPTRGHSAKVVPR